jgi:hypothetical protein
MSDNIPEIDLVTGVLYQESLTAMKRILDLGEFKIGAANSKEYAFFKREVMDSVYTALRNTLESWEEEGVVRPCDLCNRPADLRKGWKPCACRGCGFLSND